MGAAADEAPGDDPLVWLLDGGLRDLAVGTNSDLAEERLVEQPFAEIACRKVGLKRRLGELQCVIEGLADVGELDL